MGLREFGPTRVPRNWKDSIWPGFEARALEMVCVACVRLRGDQRRRLDWEERHYSWAFVRHFEEICLERNLSFSPRYDPHELSDAEFAAGKSPKSAPVLDICIRWHQHIPEIRFPIEAKILVVATLGTRRRRATVVKYVEKGIRRFIEGKYARELPSGAILGYVLVGRASQLAGPINDALEENEVPFISPLTAQPDRSSVVPRYLSSHPRRKAGIISLHHLFVEFAPLDQSE